VRERSGHGNVGEAHSQACGVRFASGGAPRQKLNQVGEFDAPSSAPSATRQQRRIVTRRRCPFA
jgi:hypothetical protein